MNGFNERHGGVHSLRSMNGTCGFVHCPQWKEISGFVHYHQWSNTCQFLHSISWAIAFYVLGNCICFRTCKECDTDKQGFVPPKPTCQGFVPTHRLASGTCSKREVQSCSESEYIDWTKHERSTNPVRKLCHAQLAMLRNALLCCAMPYYAMLCFAVLCFAMLCCATTFRCPTPKVKRRQRRRRQISYVASYGSLYGHTKGVYIS